MNHNCWFDWIEHSCDFDQLIMETSKMPEGQVNDITTSE